MPSAHPNYFSGPVTLAAGNNNLETDIIPVVAPGMNSSLVEFTWRPISGGPVSESSNVMASVADGAAYAVGDAITERGPGPIPANKINFYPTAPGDVIELVIRTR